MGYIAVLGIRYAEGVIERFLKLHYSDKHNLLLYPSDIKIP